MTIKGLVVQIDSTDGVGPGLHASETHIAAVEPDGGGEPIPINNVQRIDLEIVAGEFNAAKIHATMVKANLKAVLEEFSFFDEYGRRWAYALALVRDEELGEDSKV